MIKVALTRLSHDVAVLLGEALSLECHPEESPFPDLEDRVRVLAPGVLSRIVAEAEAGKLKSGKILQGPVTTDENATACLVLPEDFLRLVYLKLDCWTRPLRNLSPPGSLKESLIYSRWKGLRGNHMDPVAVQEIAEGGNFRLRICPASPGSRIETGLYIPEPKIGEDGTLELGAELYPELIERLAQKVQASLISPTIE